ncbi:polyketide antibiotic transporter [Agromyces sp. CFH 90414]|uniref:Polyketide antibiotic transporter n=1 Tax=Agromyces agglutinans TaxID=2662258 RepID=A0A6I2F2C4_9MICO|nr:polyketide antibiotic transporter [Agromyces agglutinans]MRG59645.1 polyketide antibiotic transporter [Agromyces agglutinans]
MSTLPALLGQRLRRDWLQLVLWIAGIAALGGVAASAVTTTFGDETERAGVLALTATAPAILIFRGTPNGADAGPFAFFLIFAFLALMAGLMSTFLAVRHTRAEEEQGRAELVGATPAGRVLPTVATVVHGVLANAVVGLAVAGAFIAGGFEVAGSLTTGAATAATGVAFLAFGLFAAQLFRTSRAANTCSVAFVLGAYVVRGIGDATGTYSDDGQHVTPSWVSWLSPIGWAQRTEAFAEDDLVPLLLPLGFAVLLVGLVFAFQSVRDQGASVLAGGRGRATAGPVLSSGTGLAWELSRGAIIAWAVGALATGLLATSLTPLIDQIGTEVPAVAQTLEQMNPGGSLGQALTATFFSIVGILAAAAALQVVIRARQEEAHGTAELLLAVPLSRTRWLVGYLVIGALAIAAILVTAALGAVIGAQRADDPAQAAGDAIEAALAQFPAALLFLAIGLVLFVYLPRLTIALSWAALGALAVLGVFGDLLAPPEWMADLSPFTHSPIPIGDDIDWTGGFWMLGLAAAGSVVAVWSMRRRELAPGG